MGEVRTIFIGGLPRDCTERELHLLFYEGGGCEGIRLQRPAANVDPRSRGGRVTAFVQFDSRERAVQAATFINGMVYDPVDPSSTLRVEMAKQDFRRIPTPASAPLALPPPVAAAAGMAAKRQRSQLHESKLSEKDASTLFVGGLGEAVSQQELTDYASSQDGFVQVSMKDEGTPRAVGWVQYASPDLAALALVNLAAFPLPSLGRPPNIEHARTNTGERAAAAPVPHPVRAAAAPYRGGWNTHQGAGAGAGGGGSSTVFLGSLEPQVSEAELQALLSSYEGFARLTTRGLGQGRGTAWAQFDSHENASNACVVLQQTAVPSMGRPANVELARSDMRS